MNTRARWLLGLALTLGACAAHEQQLRSAETTNAALDPASGRLQATSTSSVPGTLPADFNASANGAAQYVVPLAVPPGIRQLQPHLSVVYGSDSKNGMMGVGWRLGGLSSITRCRAIPDTDGVRGAVAYDAGDRYCLDGQRLINVTGNYGAASSVYRTELETWRRVEASSSLCGSGPCSFTVEMKDGQKWSYGTSSDSAIPALGRRDIRVWALQKIQDLNGNTLVFSYTADPTSAGLSDGQYYPLRIDYTGNEAASVTASRAIVFKYSPREDITTLYQGGSAVTTRFALTTIQTLVQDAVVSEYNFTYQSSAATGRSLLQTAQVCAGTGTSATCMTPTRLTWQGDASLSMKGQSLPTSVSNSFDRILPADLNGDGRGDLLYITQASGVLSLQPMLSTGADFTSCGTPLQVASSSTVEVLDVNGDGMADLVTGWEQTGREMLTVYLAQSTTSCSFQALPDFSTNQPANPDFTWAMDVNGDGRTDLVMGWQGNTQASLAVFLGGSAGLSAGGTATIPNGDTTQVQLWPMDLNGDGQVDLVQRVNDTGALVLASYLSNGSSFTAGPSTTLQSGATGLGLWRLDVNGDGNTDFVQGFLDGSQVLQLTPLFSNGAGGFVQGTTLNTGRGYGGEDSIWSADVSGDGSTDLVQAWNDKGTVALIVYRNTGNGLDTGVEVATGLSAADFSQTWPMDFNADGRMDLVQGFASSGVLHFDAYVTQGVAPDLISTFQDGLGGKVTITYKPISDPSVYTPDGEGSDESTNALAYAYRRAPDQPPFQVVSGGVTQLVSRYVLSSASGSGLAYEYGYTLTYTNALTDLTGRGWLGFKTTSQVNEQTGRRTTTTYNQGFPLTGTVAKVTYSCDGSLATDPLCPKSATATPLSGSTTTYGTPVVTTRGATAPNPPIYVVQRKKVQMDTYVYGKLDFSRAQTFDSYDAFGNPTLQSDLGYVDSSGNDKSSSDNVYTCSQYNTPPSGVWAYGFLTAIKVSSSRSCSNFASFTNGTDYSLEKVTYDSQLNLLTQAAWDDSNSVWLTTSYTYDKLGNVLTETQPGKRVSVYTYEPTYGTYVQTRTVQAAGGPALVETFGFDPRFGAQAAYQDVNGNVFVNCVDDFGRVVQRQGPVPAGASMTADTSCLGTSVTGPASTFAAAPVVTLESVQHSSDSTAGLYTLVQELQDWGPAATRSMRWHRAYYDGLGRPYLRVSQSSAGNVAACAVLDSESRITAMTVPYLLNDTVDSCASASGDKRLWSLSTYDTYGRLTRLAEPSGPSGTGTTLTTLAYALGDTVTLTTAAGESIQQQKVLKHQYFFSEHKPVEMTAPGDGNATSTYSYDRIGRLLSFTDPPTTSNPSGVRNSMTYDALNRTLTVNNPDQNTVGGGKVAMRYQYDPTSGLLASTTDTKGQTTAYTYDALGRVLTKKLADGSVISSTYDQSTATNGLGSLTHVEAKAASGTLLYTFDYGYDSYGNQSSSTLALPGQGSYATTKLFDPQSRLATQTWPDQSTLTQQYTLGDLTVQTVGTQTVARYEQYTPLGSPQSVTYGNGVTTSYRYAPTGELLTWKGSGPGSTQLWDRTLTWNDLRQVTALTDNLKSSVDFSQTFGFTNGRLTSASAPGLYGNLSYTYDASGNLTSDGTTTYTYSAHRVKGGTQGQTSVLSLGYDANGNITSKLAGGTTWRYTFDPLNRLTQVMQGSAAVLTVPVHGPDDQRIVKVDAAGNKTLYAGDGYVVTVGASGVTQTERYVVASTGTVASFTTPAGGPASALYFHPDHLGSTGLTTDGSGALSARVAYMPYGGVLTSKSSGPTDFRPKFQAKELDASGLYYFGARYYDPALYRFVSPDSQLGGELYDFDTINRFAFALNNPVTFMDPTGHSVWGSILGDIVGVLEIIAGVAVDVLSAGALEPVGGTLLGAGLGGLQYSAAHVHDFSWKQYGIQTGIGAVTGLVTGGLGGEAEVGVGMAEQEAELEAEVVSTRALEGASSEVAEDAAGLEASESAGVRNVVEEERAPEMGGERSEGARGGEERGSREELEEDEQGACELSVTSFAAGTRVRTLEGLRPIEEVRPGSAVLGFNGQTGAVSVAEVVQAHPLVGHRRYVLQVGEQRLESTADQRLFVIGRGWVRVEALQPGDLLRDMEGGERPLLAVAELPGEARFYELEVAGLHSFFVSEQGLLAHNARTCREVALGRTPSKRSRAGKDVLKRWLGRGKARLKSGKYQVKVRVTRGGARVWKPLDQNIHMGHRLDAVKWWNAGGYKFGARSPQARAFMLDDSNYRFEWGPLNSSYGASLRVTYVRPQGWVGPWPP